MEREILKLMDSVEEFIPQTSTKLGDEFLICECFCVSAGDIRRSGNETIDLEFLKNEFELGNGCQGCIRRKEDWIDKIF